MSKVRGGQEDEGIGRGRLPREQWQIVSLRSGEAAMSVPDIQMVFLHRSPGKDLAMIKKWLASGYVLFRLNDDRAYFERRTDAEKANA
jgi:hypothetical protein